MFIRKSHLFIASITTFFLGIVYYLFNTFLDGSCWAGMRLSQTVAKIGYCEFSHMDAFLRQNMNSYSNLAYFFFGMVILLTGLSDRRTKNNTNPLTRFPVLSIIFGSCLIYLCFGSTFFHASLTWPGQRWDMNGTYSVAIVLLLVSVYRLLYKPANDVMLKKMIVISFFILLLLFVYLHLVINSFVLLPAMMLAIIILTSINMVRHKIVDHKLAFLSLFCLISACVLRQLDVAKIFCDPNSILQGHSAWHFLIGASPFLLYFFYRSETPD